MPKCENCGKTFEQNPNYRARNGRQKYCSRKCCQQKYKTDHFYRRYRTKQKETAQKLRIDVLTHYGGNPPKCACCGETIIEFLTIDHINGGGHKQMIKINRRGTSFYRWLIQQRFPEGLQVLCMNCNFAKGKYGKCPHKIS